MNFVCDICKENFTKKSSLDRHLDRGVCTKDLCKFPELLSSADKVALEVIEALPTPSLKIKAAQRMGTFVTKVYPMVFMDKRKVSRKNTLSKIEHLFPADSEFLLEKLILDSSQPVRLLKNVKVLIDEETIDLSQYTIPINLERFTVKSYGHFAEVTLKADVIQPIKIPIPYVADPHFIRIEAPKVQKPHQDDKVFGKIFGKDASDDYESDNGDENEDENAEMQFSFAYAEMNPSGAENDAVAMASDSSGDELPMEGGNSGDDGTGGGPIGPGSPGDSNGPDGPGGSDDPSEPDGSGDPGSPGGSNVPSDSDGPPSPGRNTGGNCWNDYADRIFRIRGRTGHGSGNSARYVGLGPLGPSYRNLTTQQVRNRLVTANNKVHHYVNIGHLPEIMTSQELKYNCGVWYDGFYHHLDNFCPPLTRERIFSQGGKLTLYLEKLKHNEPFDRLAFLRNVSKTTVWEIFWSHAIQQYRLDDAIPHRNCGIRGQPNYTEVLQRSVCTSEYMNAIFQHAMPDGNELVILALDATYEYSPKISSPGAQRRTYCQHKNNHNLKVAILVDHEGDILYYSPVSGSAPSCSDACLTVDQLEMENDSTIARSLDSLIRPPIESNLSCFTFVDLGYTHPRGNRGQTTTLHHQIYNR